MSDEEQDVGFDGKRDLDIADNEWVRAWNLETNAGDRSRDYALLAIAAEVRGLANEILQGRADFGSLLMEGGPIERELSRLVVAVKENTKALGDMHKELRTIAMKTK